MILRRMACVVVLIALASPMSVAGIRSAGKYSGVVLFDRWGGCMLYGGVFVMYISEGVKEQLRAEVGKCVQIDATKVVQPENPGDGVIKKFTFLGAVPSDTHAKSSNGLKISAAPDFQDGHVPQFMIRVENVSDQPLTINTEYLAPTVLAAKTKGNRVMSPSDGPSVAVVTRQSFWSGGDDRPRMKSEGTDQSVKYQWWVTVPANLEKSIIVQPKAAFELHLSFKMQAGEYEFLAGYGGSMNAGRCIASNLIAFDAKADGTARLVKVAGR